MQMTDTHMKKCSLVTKETQIVNTIECHHTHTHTHTPEWLKFFQKTKNANSWLEFGRTGTQTFWKKV